MAGLRQSKSPWWGGDRTRIFGISQDFRGFFILPVPKIRVYPRSVSGRMIHYLLHLFILEIAHHSCLEAYPVCAVY